MERLRELFDPNKPIERRIEKVITYDTTDSDLLRQEIQEYVVTESIEQNLERLLDLLDEGMSGSGSREVGVWVSGFYGSGKSSLTKYLGFALDSSLQLEGRPFLDWLQDQCTSQPLRSRLATVARKHPMTVIMIDLASQAFAGARQEPISNILYYRVMQWAGYARDKKIAYLEFMLERDGKMAEFEQRLAELSQGRTWAEMKNQPLAAKTFAARLASEFYPHIWPDAKAFNELKLEEAEREDERIKEILQLICRKSGKPNVLFIIDEVGQYVAQRDDLILNLDGLAKNLKNIGRGQAWIIATAQQTLTEDDPGAALNTAKLYKLKDRFPVTIDLEAKDIREICYRRLLSKSPAGEKFLGELFDQYGPQLRQATQLTGTRYYQAELTKATFIQFYPFLPLHLDILLNLLAKLAKTRGGIGLRSAIKVIQDVLIDQSKLRPGAKLLADEGPGTLATAAIFYDTLQKDIGRSFPHIVSGLDKVQKIFGPDSRQTQVAKAIAVLQLLDGFPVSRKNLAAVLHPSVTAASLGEEVATAVADLLHNPEIPLSEVDGSLRFMSAAVSELERKRLELTPKLAETQEFFYKALRQIFTPMPTARLQGARTVEVGLKIEVNGRPVSLAGDREELQLQLEFVPAVDYESRRQARLLESQQRSNHQVVFLLGREVPELDKMLLDVYRSRTIFDLYRTKTVDKEIEDYLRAENQRADRLVAEVERLLKKSLLSGSFLFRGQAQPVSMLGEELLEATKKFLEEVGPQVYVKWSEAPLPADSGLAERFLRTENLARLTSKDDPLALIKRGSIGFGIEDKHPAIVSLRDYLEHWGQVEGRRLLDDFAKAPYGWFKDTTRYLIAAMLVGGMVKLRIGGEDITVRGDKAIQGLKNTANFNKIGISLREVKLDPEKLLRARNRLVELTGEDILPLEEDISKVVIKHFPDLQQEYAPLAVQLRTLGLPGWERVEAILDNLAELLKGDASDAANRLGGVTCHFFEDLLWVREVKKAFDNNIEAVIGKANTYLKDIPLLPPAGIPGELIAATVRLREQLAEYLARDDFYRYQPEIRHTISELEKIMASYATALQEEQQKHFNAAKEALQNSPSWLQLGPADQARFAQELDALSIGSASDLAGFQRLLREKYTLDMRLAQLAREIDQIINAARQKRRVLEKDLTALPKVITSPDQLQAIIAELQGLLEELPEYEEVILRWQ